MPEEIKEALTRVASALPPVAWHSAEELRRRAGVRRRRRVVLTVSALLLVVAVGVVPVRHWLQHTVVATPSGTGNGSSSPGLATSCPGGGVPAKIELPELRQISLNVYNGTLEDGLAQEISVQLRNRGFEILTTDNASVIGVDAGDEVAVIRYGPEAVGAAWVMLAFFPGARMEFDLQRREAAVDVVLGRGFLQLPTLTEVNQQIAANGRAVAPPGTCAVG